MRATIGRFLPTLACLALAYAATYSHAQGCRSLYTFNYDSYATESGNATTIFTTVVTEGSGSGDPIGCVYTNVVHTPKSYNTITPPGGTPVGGWVNGSSGSMTSYIQSQNDQQVAATPGVTYIFDSEGEVICSVFGELYSFTDEVGVGLHRATYAATPAANNSCNLKLSCPAGQTAVCGTSAYSSGSGNPCDGPWLNLLFLAITKGTTKSCYGVGPNVWSGTQGHCD